MVLCLPFDLGATPAMELMIAAGKAVPKLQPEHGLAVDRVYTGSFLTSLDMAGFSISIMKADQAILHRLDAATKSSYWPVGVDEVGHELTSDLLKNGAHMENIKPPSLEGLDVFATVRNPPVLLCRQ